jgi:hypothetical protein
MAAAHDEAEARKAEKREAAAKEAKARKNRELEERVNRELEPAQPPKPNPRAAILPVLSTVRRFMYSILL